MYFIVLSMSPMNTQNRTGSSAEIFYSKVFDRQLVLLMYKLILMISS